MDLLYNNCLLNQSEHIMFRYCKCYNQNYRYMMLMVLVINNKLLISLCNQKKLH